MTPAETARLNGGQSLARRLKGFEDIKEAKLAPAG